jgi:hypothetical protein
MRELRIRDAFTSDRRFRQPGFTPLLKLEIDSLKPESTGEATALSFRILP